jgi:hypothetical protein
VIGRGRADRSGLGGGGGACEACRRSSRACRVGAPPPRCAASVNPELRHGATKAKPRPLPVLVEAAAPSTIGARIGCRWDAQVHAEFRTGRGAPFLSVARDARGEAREAGGCVCCVCCVCWRAGSALNQRAFGFAQETAKLAADLRKAQAESKAHSTQKAQPVRRWPCEARRAVRL